MTTVVSAALTVTALRALPFSAALTDWLLLGVLILGAAIAHAFPIRSAFDGATYRLTNVFVVAGAVILPASLLTLLPVLALLPDSWRKRQSAGVWVRWLFNVAQTVLAAHAASAWVQWLTIAGGSGEVSFSDLRPLAALLGAALLFTLLQEVLVGMAIALNSRIPLLRADTLTLPALLSDGMIGLLGVAVAGLWLAKPVLLVLVLPMLLVAYRLTRPAHLAQLAQVDTKTGLHNSHYFERALEEELAHSQRVRRPFAVLFADMDNFKRINDQYGHASGDRVLRDTATVLTSALRKGDVIARFGGEEFVALLPGTEAEEALYAAERLRTAVANHLFELDESTRLCCTISVGVATYPQDGGDVATLLKQAKLARKAGGPAQAVLATPLAPEPAPAAGAQPVCLAQSPSRLAPFLLWDTVVAGMALAAGTLFSVTQASRWPLVLPFLALAVAAEFLKVQVYEANRQGISLSFTIAVTMAAVTVDPASAPLVSLAGAVVHVASHWQRQVGKSLFNLANPTLAAAAVSASYLLIRALGGAEPRLAPWDLVAATVAVLVFFLIDNGNIALMISLHARRPIQEVLRGSAWSSSTQIMLGLTGAFLVQVYHAVGWLGVAMFIAPVLIMRLTLAFYARESQRTINVLQALNRQLADENAQRTAAEQENARLAQEAEARAAALAASEEQLRTRYAAIACGVLVQDPAGHIVHANAAAEEILGLSFAAMRGHRPADLWQTTNEPSFGLQDQASVSTGPRGTGSEIRVVRADSQIRWLLQHTVPIEGRAGAPPQTVVSFIDISERKRAQQRLAIQYTVTRVLAEETTLDDAVPRILEAVCAILDWQMGVYWGVDQPSQMLRCLHQWQQPSFAAVELQESGRQLSFPLGVGLPGQIWASGQPLWLAAEPWPTAPAPAGPRRALLQQAGLRGSLGFPITSEGAILGVLMFFSQTVQPADHDMLTMLVAIGSQIGQFLEQRRVEAALQYQAIYDALTGLPNRHLLHDRLQQALLVAQRGHHKLALLVMDLDQFREVNDTLGHHFGDALLQQVGLRLRAHVSPIDTVARLGGDEFAVLLPTVADEMSVALVARQLLQAIDQPFLLQGQRVDARLSIGIVLSPDHGRDAETLLRRADVAMYTAKRTQSGYVAFTHDQDQHSPDRLALMSELRQAIEQDQLLLYYQPKASFQPGAVVSVEALVRWPHAERGLIPPDQFIPLAEQTGLIRGLSRWVLNAALRQCHLWQQAGLAIPVAINLSMRNLHDPDLLQTVSELLAAWGVPPTWVKVEITESSLMADPDQVMKTLNQLRAMGVGIAIDDFGTGHSSLAYLKRLPVDELKIDKSFVANMVKDENDLVIVRSTIDLGHNLGLRVVAEGVEDQATWDKLAALGCDIAQGYYLGRPMPAADFLRWLGQSPWSPSQIEVVA